MREFCLTIFFAPRARDIVTTAGNASGIAATARLTAVRNIKRGASPLKSPVVKTIAHITITVIPSLCPNFDSLFCRGVRTSSSSCSKEAIFPSSVFIPVETTMPVPRPYDTVVPLKAMFTLSPSGINFSSSVHMLFSTGTDSPVSAASSIFNFAASVSLISAGIILPASSMTMSPGTIPEAGTLFILLSLYTKAFGAAIFFKALMAFSALYSCTNPMIALSITITIIAIVSAISPIIPDITAAAINTIIMKSLNCSRNIIKSVFFFISCNSFGP